MSSEQTFQRTPNTQTASWFLDIRSSGSLNLDPPYQRRSVWNLEYRKFFIDSVMRNYPTQSIFLDVVVGHDTRTEYRVLDGKQRLSSLISFGQDEFPAPDSLADLGLSGLYYSEFPHEMKVRLLSYMFTVESVTHVSSADLNEAFNRLNRNVARLNKQELRHAQFGGRFISKMENLAEDPFWEDVGLVTQARQRRMLDVEYVSELYVVVLRGIQDGKSYLDDVYAELDSEIRGEREADRRFRATRRYLEAVNQYFAIWTTRFANVADFYALWAAVTSMIEANSEPSPDEAASGLADFVVELEAQHSNRARSYLLAARQGSNKASNRELRTQTLVAVLSRT